MNDNAFDNTKYFESVIISPYIGDNAALSSYSTTSLDNIFASPLWQQEQPRVWFSQSQGGQNDGYKYHTSTHESPAKTNVIEPSKNVIDEPRCRETVRQAKRLSRNKKSCEFCGRTFTRKYNLKSHRLLHTRSDSSRSRVKYIPEAKNVIEKEEQSGEKEGAAMEEAPQDPTPSQVELMAVSAATF